MQIIRLFRLKGFESQRPHPPLSRRIDPFQAGEGFFNLGLKGGL